MLDELELIAKARQLDKSALAEIYDRYSPGLYRYAMRLLGDSDQAEDCVAETFSRFLNTLHRGGGPNNYLQAYLYRIAHNSITDGYRRKTPLMTPLDENLQGDDSNSPVETLQEELDKQTIRNALAYLTPDQRQVIVLKYLEGWKNAEVAAAIGKSSGAVKALNHRAISALKRQLVSQEERI